MVLCFNPLPVIPPFTNALYRHLSLLFHHFPCWPPELPCPWSLVSPCSWPSVDALPSVSDSLPPFCLWAFAGAQVTLSHKEWTTLLYSIGEFNWEKRTFLIWFNAWTTNREEKINLLFYWIPRPNTSMSFIEESIYMSNFLSVMKNWSAEKVSAAEAIITSPIFLFIVLPFFHFLSVALDILISHWKINFL